MKLSKVKENQDISHEVLQRKGLVKDQTFVVEIPPIPYQNKQNIKTLETPFSKVKATLRSNWVYRSRSAAQKFSVMFLFCFPFFCL